jgi:hypothetical protein
LLVLGVDDETGERLVEPALRKGRQVRVEALVDRRGRRRQEAVTAQLFGGLLDLAGRDAVHAHLGKGGDQRLFGALVAFEQLGREISVTVLRDPQLKPAHTLKSVSGHNNPNGSQGEPTSVRSSPLKAAPAANRGRSRRTGHDCRSSGLSSSQQIA